jgi:filamentous hemagglutinin family protein
MHSLNQIYRTIWSEALGAWVAVSEITKSKGKRSASSLIRAIDISSEISKTSFSKFKLHPKPFLVALACACSLSVQANPIGGTVTNGQATFNTTGNTLTVTNTPGTIINWQGFSINANEVTKFAQQSATSTILNRVTSANPSSILGSLQSNGRVFLVNPNGIVFGAGSTVNVAGLVATTLKLSDADFLAGNHHYAANTGAQNISNAGSLTALDGGQIYLIAPNVDNSGVITAPNGEILLAAGSSVDLVNSNSPSLSVNITAPAGNVTNIGKLIASAGSLGLVGTLVNSSGKVSADSATLQGGKIVFKASQSTTVTGTVSANGTSGGTIEVLGNQVGVLDGATISASGTQNGGTVLIGGDAHGTNPDVQNAQATFVASTAGISADGGVTPSSASVPSLTGGGVGRGFINGVGNGGKVVVWSDNATQFTGNISAQGGANGGNGGWIEVSGKQWLGFEGLVNTQAAKGIIGTLLLDPMNITISNSVITGSMVATPSLGGTSPTTFADATTLTTSNLTVATLVGQLALSNVTVDTTSAAGTGTGNITVQNAISWNSANSLTLNATSTGAIVTNTGATITNLGTGGLSLLTAGGSITLGGGISLAGGTLTATALGATSDILINSAVNVGASGTIGLTAGRYINEGTGGSIVGNSLTTNANGGTWLTGGATFSNSQISTASNAITSFSATDTSGSITLLNAASTLTLGSITAGQMLGINNVGNMTIPALSNIVINGVNGNDPLVGGFSGNLAGQNVTADLVSSGANAMFTNLGSISLPNSTTGLEFHSPKVSLAGGTISAPNSEIGIVNVNPGGLGDLGSTVKTTPNTLEISQADVASISTPMLFVNGIINITAPISFANTLNLYSPAVGYVTPSISESASGSITAGALITTSVGGTALNNANAVGSFSATNSGVGNISLTNAATTLALGAISNAGGGSLTVNNTGAISVNGAISTGAGAINLTASGSIAETLTGTLAGVTLTTSAVGGTSLTGANAVTSFLAIDSADVLLINTVATLTLGAITTGGTLDVENNGALTISAPIVVNGLGTVPQNGWSAWLLSWGANSMLTNNSSVTLAAGGNGVGFCADKMALSGGSVSAPRVILNTSNPATLTDLGSIGKAATLTLELSQADIATINSPSLYIGVNNNMNITAPISYTAGDLYLWTDTPGAVGAGSIGESGLGTITANKLITSAVGGITLNGANAVGSFSASNITSGNISLVNTATTLTLNAISNAGGGSVTVNSSNDIVIAAAVNAGTGTLNLTAIRDITENAGGSLVSNGMVLSAGRNLTLTSTNSGASLATWSIGQGGAGGVLDLSSWVIAGGTSWSFVGGAGTDTIKDMTHSRAIVVSGANSGSVGGVTPFTSIESFSSGAANVTVNFTSVGSLSGTLYGGGTGTATLSGATAGAINVTGIGLTPLIINALNAASLDASGVASISINGALNTGAGAVVLSSSGTISEGVSGTITAVSLQTSGAGGTTLNGANVLGNFAATDTSNVALNNVASTIMLGPITTGGTFWLYNAGNITVASPININGTASLSGGAIGFSGQLISAITDGLITNNSSITLGAGSQGLVLVADKMNLAGASGSINAAGSKVILNTWGLPTLVNLGSTLKTSANTLELSQADFASINSPSIWVVNNNNLIISAAINVGAAELFLDSNCAGCGTAGGVITEGVNGSIVAGLLKTNSLGGTTLTGANAIGSFSATNATSGNISLTNTATTLTLNAISNTVGSVSVVSSNDITENSGAGLASNGLSLSAGRNLTLGTINSGSGAVQMLFGQAGAGGILDVTNVNFTGPNGRIYTGGTGVDTLKGVPTGSGTTLTFTGVDAGNIDGTTNFTGIENFDAGGTANINIVFSGGGLSGTFLGRGTGTISASGSATGAVNVTSLGANPFIVNGLIAGSLNASGMTSIAINGALNTGVGAVSLTSSGTISEGASGTITAGSLQTSGIGGTTLNGANIVGSFNATNSTSGAIAFTNTGALTIAGLSNSGGGVDLVTNTGSINITGTIAAAGGGAINLTETAGAITESGPGLINTSGLLTINSVTGETLNGANKIGSLAATNTSSGDIALINTSAPFTINNVSNTGGNLVFDNTGGIIIAGAVNTSGGLKLTAHSPITVNSGGSINAVGDVVLTAGSAGSAAPGDIITINGSIIGKSVMLAGNRVTGNIPAGAIIQVAVTTPAPTVMDTLTAMLAAYSTDSFTLTGSPVTAPTLTTADVAAAGTDSQSANEKKEEASLVASAETPAKLAEAPTAKPIPVCK